ncbi:phosphotransferase family protein [Pseudonocardia sp. GCM10023141]|uniref:phosphotransferase family protein n=1 Tax=Pseudonocardia sp. GCM10023141 TaxID=3252653 RepID=UPI00360F80BE
MTELAERLAGRLAALLGEPVGVEGLHRLTGGASQETWAFEAVTGATTRRLVLRQDPADAVRPGGMALEAAAITAAAAAGVPVPRLVDHGVFDTPYLITEHVDGETIARKLLREERYAAARAGLAAEMGRTLARIHSVPLTAVPGLPSGDPVEQLRQTADEVGEPLPTVEIALRWLDQNRPEPVPAALVHGDFRNGNLIVDERGIRAVLDWELAHRGDPREDLGWVCVKAWRFGTALPVGGFGTVTQLLDGYAEVAGQRPAESAVHWWLVHRTTWWALGCREMAERHLSGETSSVELAAIGRRVCEQEHDLLLALGEPAGPVPAPVAAPHSDLHGHPSAGELVAAVAAFLRSEVQPGADARLGFLGRVSANALDGVERELRLGPEQERRHRERLAALGYADQAGLCAAIRSGELAHDDPTLRAVVREAVTDRLAVANPKYLRYPG